jgi:uncharacterized protein (TIGR00730 family)
VTGGIPQLLVKKELAHTGLSRLEVVGSMHERKTAMAQLSGGYIALPGGFGTVEEFFEVLTWAQLGLHGQPCALLDVAGCYEHLLLFLDHAMKARLVKPVHRSTVLVSTDPGHLLDEFEAYRAPSIPKWIGVGGT